MHALPRAVALLALVLAVVLPTRPARADVLELTDGRLVEGVVVKEGDTYRVLSRFGEATVPAAQVKAHAQAPDVDQQIRDHLAALAADDTKNRALLARWLKSIGREDEAWATAQAVLEVDPEDAVAHEVLGHIRHQGVWRTPEQAKRAEGLERHGDRWYTPQEWANQSAAAREEALVRERAAEARRIQAEVNRAVRLMMSPDETLRARGLEKLLGMASAFDNPSLAGLARDVAAYVEKLDELRRAAAAAAARGAGGSGYVMGEFRATVSKLKRPIETFSTSLASNLGGAPVRIQLPELEVIRIRTTGIIPVVVK